MQMVFLIRQRCNAACLHCTVDSGPDKPAELSPDKIRSLMDEAAELREPGVPLRFSFSGGEPFLKFARLVELVRHGAALGARISCVSNGYWAVDDRSAADKLTRLREAGLEGLAVSTSRFHREYVPVERVQRALRAARALGLFTTLKCAVTVSDSKDGWAQALAEAIAPDAVEIFAMLPYLRRGASLPEHEYPRVAGIPEGTCPAPLLTIREDGGAYTCCNPGAFAGLLRLGNVHEAPLRDLRDAHVFNGVQRVLCERGPAHFARRIVERGQGHRLRTGYADVCDLCAHIATDPALAAIATEEGEAYERADLSRLVEAAAACGPLLSNAV